MRILTWGGIGYSTAQWQRYFASLYRGKLYLQEREGAASVARTVNAWSNRWVGTDGEWTALLAGLRFVSSADEVDSVSQLWAGLLWVPPWCGRSPKAAARA